MGTLVRLENITKRFSNVTANDHINFEVQEGEIHALLGGNGAGKTTLMNILYGLYTPDKGQIYLKNRPVKVSSPAMASSLGIEMVHQNFMLIPAFSVAENSNFGWL